MRAQFEKVPLAPGRSWMAFERTWRGGKFDAPWHFHPEGELTLILEGRGRRFVGDHQAAFGPHDLALLNGNLPHFWHSEGAQPQGARAVVIQFRPEFFSPRGLALLPEFSAVGSLLERARRGLHFTTAVARQLTPRLRAIATQRGTEGALALLGVLHELSLVPSAHVLAGHNYAPALDHAGADRLRRVYAYVLAHYREPLPLAQIAQLAGLTREGFSRYFKRTTGVWFSDFLTQLRIDNACRALMETDENIAAIAFAAGFGTLGHFNRQFRATKGCSPSAFRTAHPARGGLEMVGGQRKD